MIKSYKVYVNGKAYEVQVEETGGAVSPQVPIIAPAPQSKADPVSPRVEQAPTPPSAPVKEVEKPKTAAAAGGKGKGFSAPMSGLIIDVFVKSGQNVKNGDVLLKIEAMKMENDIICDTNGVVEEVFVQKGENVETGKNMVSVIPL